MTTKPSELELRTTLPVNLIASVCLDGGIGLENQLPWRLSKDMKFFSKITQYVKCPGLINAVVMGRKTYDSLPQKFKPLPNRLNVVVSTTLSPQEAVDFNKDIVVVPSLDEAINKIAHTALYHSIETIFIIGGGQIYEKALSSLYIKTVYLTVVAATSIKCDIFCPSLLDLKNFVPTALSRTHGEKGLTYVFVEYQNEAGLRKKVALQTPFQISLGSLDDYQTNFQEKISCLPTLGLREHSELQYLDAIADILNNGIELTDRTGVGVYAKAGCCMRFDLRESFPLFTTKNVFMKGVAEELFWFIHGDTNANHLQEKGVKIWEKNGTREFLDSRGLTENAVGDLGPVYGFQWRHFGADYINVNADYSGKGIDQLKNCIDMIKNDPSSRRIVMSAWNPLDLNKMALPPCHILCQFFVLNGELSCMLYQRSGDMGLGVPFNVASYSLLCCLVAQVTNLKRGDFIHAIGNAHVYKNHVEPLKEQLKRCPRPFPILEIDPSIQDIDQFDRSHINIKGYKPYPTIKMDMAV